MEIKETRTRGFSLIESLIALTLFLFIVLAGIEVFGLSRGTLFKLEKVQMAEESVAAAVDRIRADIRSAGRGLAGPAGFEIVRSVEDAAGTLIVRYAEKSTTLTADAAVGQIVLAAADGRDFVSGRTICISDSSKGESAILSSTTANTLTLTSPLARSFSREETSIALIQKISLYLDLERSVLRRKVDGGTGQPLLEDALSFSYMIGATAPVVTVAVRTRLDGDVIHETSIHARNAVLASRR
jgi:prepilin-type N-terminal cleavage/methylation domain-containing protein